VLIADEIIILCSEAFSARYVLGAGFQFSFFIDDFAHCPAEDVDHDQVTGEDQFNFAQ